MQLYLVLKDFQDSNYSPPIDLHEGERIELDDATATHIQRNDPKVLATCRIIEMPGQDRMMRQKHVRKQELIDRSVYKAVRDRKRRDY